MDCSYKLIAVGIFILLGMNLVFSLGVNSPYWQTNPLKMYSEQTKEVAFPLENSVNEKTTEASVFLVNGSEVAQIISGEKYIVEPGKDKCVLLRITIPQSAKIGDSYNVKFYAQYSPQKANGNVQLAVGYNVDFPIVIVNKTNADMTNTSCQLQPVLTPNGNTLNKKIIIIASIILLILILLIIFIIIKLKKNRDH